MATFAIIRERLRRELLIAIFAIGACALLGFVQRYDDPNARLAGCLMFATLIGIAIAGLQRGEGRLRELELCEQSAPLYGRELARATALVPSIMLTLAVVAYWIVAAIFARPAGAPIAISLLAANSATIAALCATLRLGAARVFYLAIAIGISAVAFALGANPIVASAFCILCGFIALRQYGEALARYDPIPF